MTDCEKAVGLNVHWFYSEENMWEILLFLVTVLNDAFWEPRRLVPQIEIQPLIHLCPRKFQIHCPESLGPGLLAAVVASKGLEPASALKTEICRVIELWLHNQTVQHQQYQSQPPDMILRQSHLPLALTAHS
jgi:hypothetical protein